MVRGLALVLTAEERHYNSDCLNNPIENQKPFNLQHKATEEVIDDEQVEDLDSDENDQKIPKKVELLNSEAKSLMQIPAANRCKESELAPSITGRRRWKPQRF